MDLGLKDRVAIVAASSQGLGKAVARGLAREGARLALCARTEAALLKTADEIRGETGVDVLARAVDVTAPEQVQRFVSEASSHFGRVDICVANAGGPPSKSFADTSIEDWHRAAELNLMSTVYLARETLPLMQKRQWGRFIAITSITVKQPLEGLILSNSIRCGVSGLIKTLAAEYGPHNVLVNNICPGFTATDRLMELAQAQAASKGVAARDVEAGWAAQVPLRRVGRPEEFADVVVFLASERASYVTGVTLAVDGGMVKGLY
ncbi:MAG TPA: SDR family oxidoreductase [Bryobacteraceae bacterium]|nr:SDR family oxidoreductase [Bryobacteraceae bacterium]